MNVRALVRNGWNALREDGRAEHEAISRTVAVNVVAKARIEALFAASLDVKLHVKRDMHCDLCLVKIARRVVDRALDAAALAKRREKIMAAIIEAVVVGALVGECHAHDGQRQAGKSFAVAVIHGGLRCHLPLAPRNQFALLGALLQHKAPLQRAVEGVVVVAASRDQREMVGHHRVLENMQHAFHNVDDQDVYARVAFQIGFFVLQTMHVVHVAKRRAVFFGCQAVRWRVLLVSRAFVADEDFSGQSSLYHCAHFRRHAVRHALAGNGQNHAQTPVRNVEHDAGFVGARLGLQRRNLALRAGERKCRTVVVVRAFVVARDCEQQRVCLQGENVTQWCVVWVAGNRFTRPSLALCVAN